MAAETGVELHPCLSKSPGQDDFLGDFVFGSGELMNHNTVKFDFKF